MTAFALTLVLVAAFLHATWNLCAKRAGGGLPFVWIVGVVICSLYLPVLAGYWILYRPVITWTDAAWIAGSGGLKTCYSLLLQRGYRTGDFSLIYPLARGTGPLLSTLGAIALLGERPTPLARSQHRHRRLPRRALPAGIRRPAPDLGRRRDGNGCDRARAGMSRARITLVSDRIST